MSWPPVFARKATCVKGYGMAVDATRGLVVVSAYDADMKLYVYSLADGSLVRSFGGKGSGKGQFNWQYGGLCMTPRGTLLVAERYNNRLQEVNIDDGGWVPGCVCEAVQFHPIPNLNFTCSNSKMGRRHWRSDSTFVPRTLPLIYAPTVGDAGIADS